MIQQVLQNKKGHYPDNHDVLTASFFMQPVKHNTHPPSPNQAPLTKSRAITKARATRSSKGPNKRRRKEVEFTPTRFSSLLIPASDMAALEKVFYCKRKENGNREGDWKQLPTWESEEETEGWRQPTTPTPSLPGIDERTESGNGRNSHSRTYPLQAEDKTVIPFTNVNVKDLAGTKQVSEDSSSSSSSESSNPLSSSSSSSTSGQDEQEKRDETQETTISPKGPSLSSGLSSGKRIYSESTNSSGNPSDLKHGGASGFHEEDEKKVAEGILE